MMGRVVLTLFASTLAIMAAQANAQPAEAQPAATVAPWTPEVSVAVRYLVGQYDGLGPQNMIADHDSRRVIVAAPGGDRFFFMTYRGVLERDCMENRLYVFSARAVAQALARQAQPSPIAETSLCSSSTDMSLPPIFMPRWSNDDQITFIGGETGEDRAGYRFTISSRGLERMTPPDAHAAVYFDAAVGSSIYWRINITQAPPEYYPYARLTPGLIQRARSARSTTTTLIASFDGGAPRELVRGRSFFLNGAGARISPNGKWAIIALDAEGSSVPAAWSAYANARSASNLRFMLVDIERGRIEPLFDAPLGDFAAPVAGEMAQANILWSADSRHAVIVNTALPLTAAEPERTRTSYIVDFNVADRSWHVVERITDGQSTARTVRWSRPGEEFVVERQASNGARRATAYRYDGQQWRPRTAVPPLEEGHFANGLTVAVREDANTPPNLLATRGGRRGLLLPSDPALANVRFNPMRRVHWVDPDGTPQEGGLFLPAGLPAGQRPPLVIQPYYYYPDRFAPDGYFTTAQAAQALTNRGIAVLYMTHPALDLERGRTIDGVSSETESELRYFARRVDAAVESLASQGLVDPDRIGLNGFSRGGLHTYYAITHPLRTRISAAIIADSGIGSWTEYTGSPGHAGEHGNGANYWERFWGDRGSFWANKSGFLAGVPVFNLDRVVGATLFQNVNPGSLNTLSEQLGAFQLSRRPMESLVFGPYGFHWLQAPRQRLESMVATVDWMSLWLLGHAPETRPDDPDRPQRWQRLRQDWRRQQAWEAAGNPVGSPAPANFVAPAIQRPPTGH